MDNKKAVVTIGSDGVGFGGALFITFLILKLTGYIDWSWLWVTAPLWIPFAFLVSIFLFIGLIALIAIIVSERS